PDALADQLDPEFVGLHVLQVHLPLLHEVLLHLPAVAPGARQPRRHRAFIEPKRRDNRLRRASMAQQGQDHRHLVGRGPQPVEGRPGGGREGPPAGVANVPSLLPTLHADVAPADLPPGWAARVVTELALRVHGARPLRRVYWTRRKEHASVGPLLQISTQPRSRGVVPGRGPPPCIRGSERSYKRSGPLAVEPTLPMRPQPLDGVPHVLI